MNINVSGNKKLKKRSNLRNLKKSLLRPTKKYAIVRVAVVILLR